MKLILTATVDNLGYAGDIVQVKDGYARNYLLPQELAIVATKGAEKQVESIKRARDAREVRSVEHANELKQLIESLEFVQLEVKTHNSGKLFGSVSAKDVISAIKSAGGPTVDKRNVKLSKGHIKDIGTYPVVVKLHPNVNANLDLVVTSSE